MVYDMPAGHLQELVEAKVESQFARALRYVQAVRPSVVVPSAGPPCFLDPELFGLNVITGDELSIFPDATAFVARLEEEGIATGRIVIPGSGVTTGDGRVVVDHPVPDDEVERIFTDKKAYLEGYAADWQPWLAAERVALARTDARPAGHPAGVVGAPAGLGPDAPGGHRRRRTAPARGRRGARRGGRLPVRGGAGVGRRALRVLVRRRPPPRGDRRGREGRRLVERARSCRAASGPGAPGSSTSSSTTSSSRCHPSGWPAPRPRRAPSADGSAARSMPTARWRRSGWARGSSSATAPTGGPTWPPSDASTAACSPASSTDGSSTSRPGAASPPTTARSGSVPALDVPADT